MTQSRLKNPPSVLFCSVVIVADSTLATEGKVERAVMGGADMTLGGVPSAVPTTRTEGMLAVMASGHLCGYEYSDAERVRSDRRVSMQMNPALNIYCNGVCMRAACAHGPVDETCSVACSHPYCHV